MEDSYPYPIVNILRAINLGDLTCDMHRFRKTMLDVVSKNFRLDRALLILADENAKFTNFMVNNIDAIWVRKYKEYYHLHDPFELIDGTYQSHRMLQLGEIVELPDFFRSEYYNDFLLPQQVHHKITTHLVCGEKSLGIFGFFRSKRSPDFSRDEIKMIATISPFIAHALAHIEINARQKVQDSILNFVKQNTVNGLIIYDESLNLVFINENAKEMCSDTESGASSAKVLDQCIALIKEHRSASSDQQPKPTYKEIQNKAGDKSYLISSKIIPEEIFQEKYRLYAIAIDELREPSFLLWERLKQIYDLTKRQVDILQLMHQGSTNAQIARELSICEITVKKHIQKLFEKAGVRNRTALMHRMLVGSCSLN